MDKFYHMICLSALGQLLMLSWPLSQTNAKCIVINPHSHLSMHMMFKYCMIFKTKDISKFLKSDSNCIRILYFVAINVFVCAQTFQLTSLAGRWGC